MDGTGGSDQGGGQGEKKGERGCVEEKSAAGESHG